MKRTNPAKQDPLSFKAQPTGEIIYHIYIDEFVRLVLGVLHREGSSMRSSVVTTFHQSPRNAKGFPTREPVFHYIRCY
jgi:hypothetical protein